MRSNLSSIFGGRSNEYIDVVDDKDDENIEDPFEIEVDNDFQEYDLIDDNYSEQDETETSDSGAAATDAAESDSSDDLVDVNMTRSNAQAQQNNSAFRSDLDLRALNLPPQTALTTAVPNMGQSTIYKGANCESVKMDRVLKSVDNLRK